MAVMIDEPKCTTPYRCEGGHWPDCPRYAGGPYDRRDPVRTVAGFSHDHAFRRWSDPQEAPGADDLMAVTPEQLAKLRLETATGRALDALSPWPRLAGEPDFDFRERIKGKPRALLVDHDPQYPGAAENANRFTLAAIKRKPRLRLHVKLGKHTGMPYWAILPVECDISMVQQWQVTDANAVARAKRLMALGLPVR